jgi:hypothetical protein
MAVPGPPDAFCAVYGRAQCLTTTRFDGYHPTDKIQPISGPPGGPKIRQQHRRRSHSGEFGARNSPPKPAPTTHGWYGWNTTGGWLADDPRVVPLRPRACGGGGAGFGVQEAGGNSPGGAIPRVHGVLDHRARERGFVQLPSGSCCKLGRKLSASLNQSQLPVCDFHWPLISDKVRFEYGLTASDGIRCAGSGGAGKLIHLLGDLRHACH